jgi:hypothetical protein
MTQLYDKFNIINNINNQYDIDQIYSQIENNLENLLINDLHTIPPDEIKHYIQYCILNKIDIKNKINDILTNFLIKRRNNIKIFINKNRFSINNLNEFLESYINKIRYLNEFINYDNFIETSLNLIIDNIILDKSIINVIEYNIINFNSQNLSDIKSLLYILKQNISNDIFNNILLIIGNIYIKNFINNTNEPPINNYLKQIFKLKSLIKYNYKINNYFNNICEDNIITREDINIIIKNINIMIMENLLNIIKVSDINNLDNILNNLSNIIDTSLLLYGTEDIINEINNELINIFNNSVNNINYEIICKLFNIVSNVNIFFPNNSIDILKNKINNIIENTNVNNIYIYIAQLILSFEMNKVIDILNTLMNVSDKNKFIDKYDYYVSVRLLNYLVNVENFEKYIEMELYILEHIKSKIDDIKVNKMIHDIKLSHENINYFRNYFLLNECKNDVEKLCDISYIDKLIVSSISYNNWNIDENEISISLVNYEDTSVFNTTNLTKFEKILKLYEYFYHKIYSTKRCLYYYLHFGEIDITYLNKRIIMLPIQYMILELFENEDSINIDDILNKYYLSQYNNKFKNNVINSLITSKLLICNNNMLSLTTKDNFDTDLIQILSNMTDENIYNNDNTFVISQIEVICTLINHNLKKENMSYQTLLNTIKNNFNLFEITNELYDKALNYMCKMDYIILNDELYEKLYY